LRAKFRAEKYTGKDGIERIAYDIIGSEMKMLGNRNDGFDSGNNNTVPPTSNAPPAASQRQPPQHESQQPRQ